MAARKKIAKKTPAKPSGKVTRAAAPAKKRASGKKAPAKKPASRAARPKASAARGPQARAAQKAPAKKTAGKAVASAATPVPRSPVPPVAGAIGANDVLLSHVMSLRPRIHVGFKPNAFIEAKRALADQRYANLQDAARAVAEKAIEISNEFSPPSPFERR
jgi:hypothetical protein